MIGACPVFKGMSALDSASGFEDSARSGAGHRLSLLCTLEWTGVSCQTWNEGVENRACARWK